MPLSTSTLFLNFIYILDFFLKNIKGRFCDQVFLPSDNLCLSNPCWNGGSCQPVNATFVCNCIKPFAGKFCKETSSCTINATLSCGIGECEPLMNGNYKCHCPQVFLSKIKYLFF